MKNMKKTIAWVMAFMLGLNVMAFGGQEFESPQPSQALSGVSEATAKLLNIITVNKTVTYNGTEDLFEVSYEATIPRLRDSSLDELFSEQSRSSGYFALVFTDTYRDDYDLVNHSGTQWTWTVPLSELLKEDQEEVLKVKLLEGEEANLFMTNDVNSCNVKLSWVSGSRDETETEILTTRFGMNPFEVKLNAYGWRTRIELVIEKTIHGGYNPDSDYTFDFELDPFMVGIETLSVTVKSGEDEGSVKQLVLLPYDDELDEITYTVTEVPKIGWLPSEEEPMEITYTLCTYTATLEYHNTYDRAFIQVEKIWIDGYDNQPESIMRPESVDMHLEKWNVESETWVHNSTITLMDEDWKGTFWDVEFGYLYRVSEGTIGPYYRSSGPKVVDLRNNTTMVLETLESDSEVSENRIGNKHRRYRRRCIVKPIEVNPYEPYNVTIVNTLNELVLTKSITPASRVISGGIALFTYTIHLLNISDDPIYDIGFDDRYFQKPTDATTVYSPEDFDPVDMLAPGDDLSFDYTVTVNRVGSYTNEMVATYFLTSDENGYDMRAENGDDRESFEVRDQAIGSVTSPPPPPPAPDPTPTPTTTTTTTTTPITMGTLVVNHVDDAGVALWPAVTTTGTVGSSYTTAARGFVGYSLRATPTNATGSYTTGTTTVTYIYDLIPDTIIVVPEPEIPQAPIIIEEPTVPILDEEIPEAEPAMPQTSGVPFALFVALGGLISGIGLKMKKR